MKIRTRIILFSAVVAITVSGCGSAAELPVSAGTGQSPALPNPSISLIPTVNVVKAIGWPVNAKPAAAEGLAVNAFAVGLDHPRWIYVLPNGDVLVAETNAPPRPDDGKGIKGWFFRHFQKKAGGAVPSANRISLLRDANGDGIAETRSVFLQGLQSPFGMALVGETLYIANSDSLVKFPYVAGALRINAPPIKVVDLPGGKLNHHWTKNVIASADGSRLFVSVGSNSNVQENGADKEIGRAAIWEVDPAKGTQRQFASGLRNPVGMAWEPVTGALWTAVNERDELGSDLVPDYLTSVQDGGFYGWPYSYFGRHLDPRLRNQRPDLVVRAIVPDYALGPHTASLGLASSQGNILPERFAHGMFVGQHGSWNRKPRSGYKVIFVPFSGGKPSSDLPIDVLSGFIKPNGDAFGRPVGVAIDKRGALLVADDVGNIVWRVSNSAGPPRNMQR